MKIIIITIGTVCCLLSLATLAVGEEQSTSNHIDFGTFTPSNDGSFVEVKVNTSLIKMAARLTRDNNPEIARVLEGLKSIRVNVMEFGKDEQETIQARVQKIRKQLDDQKWERVVTVKEDESDVAIYAKLNGDESIEGLAVTVIEDEEAVLVHVDGSIRPEQLAQVGEELDLPPLKRLGGMLKNSQQPAGPPSATER